MGHERPLYAVPVQPGAAGTIPVVRAASVAVAVAPGEVLSLLRSVPRLLLAVADRLRIPFPAAVQYRAQLSIRAAF